MCRLTSTSHGNQEYEKFIHVLLSVVGKGPIHKQLLLKYFTSRSLKARLKWRVYNGASKLFDSKHPQDHREQCLDDFVCVQLAENHKRLKTKHRLTELREEEKKKLIAKFRLEAFHNLEKLSGKQDDAKISLICELRFSNEVIQMMRDTEPSAVDPTFICLQFCLPCFLCLLFRSAFHLQLDLPVLFPTSCLNVSWLSTSSTSRLYPHLCTVPVWTHCCHR